MTYLKRFSVLSLVLTFIMSLASVGIASAQEGEFCFGMDEDDCELYYELASEVNQPTSTAFDATFDADISGSGDAEIDDFQFTVLMNGAYSVDTDAYDEAIAEFAEVELLDISPRVLLELLRGQLAAVDAELEIDYVLPPEAGIPPIGPFNLWLVDGVGYVDFTPLSAFDQSLTGTFGIDMIDLIVVPLEGIEAEVLVDAIESFNDGFADGFDADDFGEDDPFSAFGEGFALGTMLEEDDLADAISIERVDDEEINGFDTVVFETTIDLAEIYAIDALAEQFYAQIATTGDFEDISSEELQEALVAAFEGSTFTITEAFDPETGYLIQNSAVGEFNLDIAPIAELDGDSAEGTFTFDFEFVFTRDDIDNVGDIELPEDAEVIPVEDLMQMGGF